MCMFWFVNYTGMVKKCGLLKIIHDKYKQRKGTDPVIEEFMGSFEAAMEHNKDLEPLLSKTQVSLKSLLLYRFENSMINYSVTNSALISRIKKRKVSTYHTSWFLVENTSCDQFKMHDVHVNHILAEFFHCFREWPFQLVILSTERSHGNWQLKNLSFKNQQI